MQRTLLHVFLALVWASFASFASLSFLEAAESTSDIIVWAVRVVTAFAFSTVGLAVLLWSWLKHDAVAYGKPNGIALTYTLASIPSCGLAIVAYFFSTRESHLAVIATLQYLAICLAILGAITASFH